MRPRWPIWGLTIAFHVVIFWSVREVRLFYRSQAHPSPIEFSSFQVEDSPVSTANATVVMPAEKSFTISTALAPLPGEGDAPATLTVPFGPGKPEEPALPSPASTSLTSGPVQSAPIVSLFQLRTNARRVVYLIDASGSMWLDMHGQTRLDRARAEVARSINSLPPDVEFNVIYFANKPVPFSPAPLFATDKIKQAALAFLHNVPDLGGETDVISGLKAALHMRPDSLFMLSDGGADDPDWKVLLAARELQQTGGNPARIYSVGFDASDSTDGNNDLLRKLSTQNGGAYQDCVTN